MSFEIKIEIPDETISDCLCSALEGGSNYWYQIVHQFKPHEFVFRCHPNNIFPHIDYPLNPGGSLTIKTLDSEEIDGQSLWHLNRNTIRKGLHVMAAIHDEHFGDLLSENSDAVTGDVLLQCCLFGKVVFG